MQDQQVRYNLNFLLDPFSTKNLFENNPTSNFKQQLIQGPKPRKGLTKFEYIWLQYQKISQEKNQLEFKMVQMNLKMVQKDLKIQSLQQLVQNFTYSINFEQPQRLSQNLIAGASQTKIGLSNRSLGLEQINRPTHLAQQTTFLNQHGGNNLKLQTSPVSNNNMRGKNNFIKTAPIKIKKLKKPSCISNQWKPRRNKNTIKNHQNRLNQQQSQSTNQHIQFYINPENLKDLETLQPNNEIDPNILNSINEPLSDIKKNTQSNNDNNTTNKELKNNQESKVDRVLKDVDC